MHAKVLLELPLGGKSGINAETPTWGKQWISDKKIGSDASSLDFIIDLSTIYFQMKNGLKL